MKQALVESADPLPHGNLFEQGAGKLNLINAFKVHTLRKTNYTVGAAELR